MFTYGSRNTWYKQLVSEINACKQFDELMESSIDAVARDRAKEIEEKDNIRKPLTSDQLEQYDEERYSEEFFLYTSSFPHYLRYAQFIAIMAMVESSLTNLCEQLVKLRGKRLNLNCYVPPDERWSKLKKIQACFAEELGLKNKELDTLNQNKHWTRLIRLMKVRNTIVHAEGKVDKETLKKAIREENPKLQLSRSLYIEPDDVITDEDKYDEALRRKAKTQWNRKLEWSEIYRPVIISREFIPSLLNTFKALLGDILKTVEKRNINLR